MNRLLSFFFLICAGIGFGQVPPAPDPTRLGPLEINGAEYRLNSIHVRGIPWATDIWGTVFYPSDLSRGPYPLVILLHGNAAICRLPNTRTTAGSLIPPACPAGTVQIPNHAGYDYIAGHLASHGYIVASINANSINVRANAISERGRLVQEHLRFWEKWNSETGGEPFGRTFSGRIDLNRVGLWGHSRGGEGVRAAYEFNRQERRPFGIKAVMELGPVDFGAFNIASANPVFNVDNVPFSVLLPVCDRDVSDTSGMRAFDRAVRLPESNPSPKSQIYLWGSNHNFSNLEWNPEDPLLRCIDYPVITTREEQVDMVQVYTMGFFRTYLGGENFRSLFSGDAPPPPQVWAQTTISYQESASKILSVEDFSAEDSPKWNNLGGETLVRNANVKVCGVNCNEELPGDWFHDSVVRAARLEWPVAGLGTPTISMGLGKDGLPKDVSTYSHFAFRAAARFSPSNPFGFASQTVSIRLVDLDGKSSIVKANSEAQKIPYPTGSTFRRSVLKTVRVPLSGFQGIDMKRISRAEILLDGQPTGSLYLTEVHFTN
jgi:hypothetical protein